MSELQTSTQMEIDGKENELSKEEKELQNKKIMNRIREELQNMATKQLQNKEGENEKYSDVVSNKKKQKLRIIKAKPKAKQKIKNESAIQIQAEVVPREGDSPRERTPIRKVNKTQEPDFKLNERKTVHEEFTVDVTPGIKNHQKQTTIDGWNVKEKNMKMKYVE